MSAHLEYTPDYRPPRLTVPRMHQLARMHYRSDVQGTGGQRRVIPAGSATATESID
jgi:hypothetical protein